MLKGRTKAGGPADESGDGGAAAAFQTQGVVERATPGAALTMVVVVTRQADSSEKGFDVDTAVVITGFKSKGRCSVGKNGAIIIECRDDSLAVTQQCVTQATFDPFRTFARALGNQARLGFGDEVFGFTESFLARLRVEFFLASRTSSTVDASAARKASVCWMLSWPSCVVS